MPTDAPGELAALGPAARAWFAASFAAPTRVQRVGWTAIASGADTLLIAPTGSGKTLAAFLVALDRLTRLPVGTRAPWQTIYVSPLKALIYDVERNLQRPLVGLEAASTQLGLPFRPLILDVRTGDTPLGERRRQLAHPGDVLVTTPESLYLLLTSEARRHFATTTTLIIDEIHALAGIKRGTHLTLCIERLARIAKAPLQRIGLSATVRPAVAVAAFLTGDAPCTIVDAAEPPRLAVSVIVPEPPPSPPAPDGPDGKDADAGPTLPGPILPAPGWPEPEPSLLADILAHQSTIVFVNSRGHAERLAQRLNELCAERGLAQDGPVIRAHHGSIAHPERRAIEDALKAGTLRAIVATSSLELGIDMGAVDLVLQVASPDSAARGLQRIGRAGHQVGAVSVGKIYPKHRADLVEAAVITGAMLAGHIEALHIPRQPLDVLAQHIVSMVATEDWVVADLARLVRRAAPYRELSDDALLAVLDMLAGVFPSNDVADLRPRLNWDRASDVLTARKGARLLATVNGGTIPDRGLYGVFLASAEPARVDGGSEVAKGARQRNVRAGVRVGELDEEMVHETRLGDVVQLGASTWRVVEITRDRVLVTHAPGEAGRLPFWRGDGPGRSLETGRMLGAFMRQVEERCGPAPDGDPSGANVAAVRWLAETYPFLDPKSRTLLVEYLVHQRSVTGRLPTDRTIVVERFVDELGDFRVCILSPFGARVHAPWALALEEVIGLRTGTQVQTFWSDDGIALRFAAGDRAPGWSELWIDPAEVEERVVARLGTSALFSGVFRENAARALLLPRRRAGGRTPLWQQRLRAQALLGAVRQHGRFPIVLETYRTCLQDVFDVPALRELLGSIESQTLTVHEVETERASPFSQGLAFALVQAQMYEVDNPVAERRAQALTLDRRLLGTLLGEDALADVFDPAVLGEVEAELQATAPTYRATDPDQLHDLLRRVAGLRADELVDRAESADPASTPESWLARLATEGRAVAIPIVGPASDTQPTLWIAIEDAALFRDALGCDPGPIPERLAAPPPAPLEALVLRYARCHGPFTSTALAARYGLAPERLAVAIAALSVPAPGATSPRLAAGHFNSPAESELIDSEVLRRVRRRMLLAYRRDIEPVDGLTFARFLSQWHRLGDRTQWHRLGDRTRGDSERRLTEALAPLAGLALSFAELETRILPARLADFRPAALDQLLATGAFVWVGAGAVSVRDGRIVLMRRELAGVFVTPELETTVRPPLEAAILALLDARGAVFFPDLAQRLQTAGHAGASATASIARALWELVWAGLVTNDTLLPLRALRRLGDGSDQALVRTMAGRWSLVRELLLRTSDTERALGRALALAERYGLAARELLIAEGTPTSGLYEALRALEDHGRLRRGFYVAPLGPAQFALPGVVDRLRAARQPSAGPALLLAATDPAQPWGSVLPWPETASPEGTPRRQLGAGVVLRGGEPLLWIAPKGDKIFTFPAARANDALAVQALRTLGAHAASQPARTLTVTELDGLSPRATRWEPLLRQAGFVGDYRGMTLTAPTGDVSLPDDASQEP